MDDDVVGKVTAGSAALTALFEAKRAFWDPVVGKFVSSEDQEEVCDALGEAVARLVCQKNDYQAKVESHWLKVASGTYLKWVELVQKVEGQAKVFLQERNKRRKILGLGFFKRPAAMEEIRKLGERIDQLKKAGDGLEGKLFVDPRPEPIVRNNEAPDIRKFGTLQKPLEKILFFLKNDKVRKLGIYGPLGIGKTTIMWNLNNHAEVAELFDIVIWVKVSAENSKENFSVEHVQRTICRRLKLDMEGINHVEEIKGAISVALSGKKSLLLLDDVKESPNFEQIGIPENSNGCKVVLTTRLHRVCCGTVDRAIKVSYLSIDEAWRMFRDVMNEPKLIKDSKIGPLAWRVCNECCGLPLLVDKVAGTFRLKNNKNHWVDGLNTWRKWPEKDRQGIKELYNLLRFCYDDLDDDYQKKCFLYGALYPEDSHIYSDNLLECWGAEDLLSKDGDKMMFAHLVLSRLKNVSLLEEGKTENHVTMHKFIRQVALYILENDSECKHLVKTNGALREPPDVKLWLEKNRISLGDNEFHKLPDSPHCKDLYTLFLQKNLGLEEIPTAFFEYMENLRVLDLSYTGITSLPSSLLLLIRLKVLYLNNCKHLKSLPTDITKLEHLEALDVQGSGIVNVPDHIENMINLRRLRVSFATSGNSNSTQEKPFNHNIISNLSRLEELAIDVETPDEWSNEVVGNIMNAVAPLMNFKTLKFFFSDKVVDCIDVAPTLCIRVPESAILINFLKKSRWRNVRSLRSFQFFISGQSTERPALMNFMRYDKYVKYCNGEGSSFPVEVLSEANAFELVNHKDIKQLSDIKIASMNNVQGCLIQSCDSFETVVTATRETVLPNLEHLYLKNLPKFRSIWEGSIQHGCLTKIKTLVIVSCDLLSLVFPSCVIEQLREIEHLVIEDCPEVEYLFDTAVSPHVLPKLRKLKLIGNQKMSEVCETNALSWPSLEKLKISDCPRLIELPFNEVNATELRVIKAEQEWWDSIYWQNKKTKEQLQKFCILSP